MWIETLKQFRRLLILVVSLTVLVIGILMLIGPGPGWLTIFLGLSILAAEFAWARRLQRRLKRTGEEIGRTLLRRTHLSAGATTGQDSSSETDHS